MHFLDFLSSSPKFFIFQKYTAKTNFGGILFLIYIIVMISISLAYIVNYAVNDKYTYDIKMIDNTTNNEPANIFYKDSPFELLNDDEELNPFINFSMIMSNSFGIYEWRTGKYLEGVNDGNMEDEYSWYNITRRVSDLVLDYHYICGNDSNCSSVGDARKRLFQFLFTGYKLDHQAEIPFQIMRDDLIMYNGIYQVEFRGGDTRAEMEFDWEVIKYKDQKSIFDSLTNVKRETIYGHFKPEPKITYEKMIPKNEYIYSYIDEKGNEIYYMNLLKIKFSNKHFEYILYERKRVEFLDILANIGALFSTIKFFFALVFNYYSKNFDNYKILGKILNSPKEPIKKIELSSNFNIEEEKDNIIKDLDKKDPLIDEALNENKMKIKESDINKDTNENNIDEDNSIVLDKLSFIDYFYNNIYSKCCKRRRNQELINSVNEIVYKYLSIDSLLYNQLKLEGLFKDYKWNNPSLSNIKNNIMIKNLKKI